MRARQLGTRIVHRVRVARGHSTCVHVYIDRTVYRYSIAVSVRLDLV
jgi:hypothetical protein